MMKLTKIVNLLQHIILLPPWIMFLNLALAAVIGYHAMKIILLLYFPPTTTLLQNSVSSSASKLSPILPLSLSPLIEANLFGIPQQSETAQITLSPAPPPASPLNLKLQGVYHSTDLSYAMITTSENKTAKYKLGETLPGGAILQEIQPKQVILLRNDRQETLYLAGMIPSATTEASNQSKQPEQLLGHYQRQLRTDPASLINLVRAYPVNQEGHFLGYRLSPGKDPSWMAQFNLQTGDIITAINGITLDSPFKGLTVMEQLTTANHLELQILRNGQTIPLTFAIDKTGP